MAPPHRGGFRGGRGGSGGGRGGFSDRGGRGGGRGGPRGGMSRGGGRGGPSRGRGGPSRGGGRGGRGGGAPRGGAGGSNKAVIERHRHAGVFIARQGKNDHLATKSYAPGVTVYGEKRIVADEDTTNEDGTTTTTKVEYRIWNPFRSKIAAGILGGVEQLYIAPGKKVLYLGAASGTTVSHVSDIVGPTGRVYAVEFSLRSGRDLLDVAGKRDNINPISHDARNPSGYRQLVDGMVDVIFCDVAQPDPARIIALNAGPFLKVGGKVLLSIKANCVDSTAPPEAVYAQVVQQMRDAKFKPIEQINLETFERGHALVVFEYLRY